jgi:Mg-chelatase subunit ChlI
MTTGNSGTDVGHPHEVDPLVAELVVTIRDRFGLHGMRDARRMIDEEIVVAEQAMAELEAVSEPEPGQ